MFADFDWFVMSLDWFSSIFQFPKWNFVWCFSFKLCLQIDHVGPFLICFYILQIVIDLLSFYVHQFFKFQNEISFDAFLLQLCLQIDHFGPFLRFFVSFSVFDWFLINFNWFSFIFIDFWWDTTVWEATVWEATVWGPTLLEIDTSLQPFALLFDVFYEETLHFWGWKCKWLQSDARFLWNAV